MDRTRLYELIYALAACDGREAVLFGHTAPLAAEAFARGLCAPSKLSELWFELPLAGEPWFDLHMPIFQADLGEGAAFIGLGGPYASSLAWYAHAKSVRQLILSFDTSTGDTQHPAVQLLMSDRSIPVAEGFLTAAGRPDLAPAYRAFIQCMPPEWYACYVGVFPRRGQGRRSEWVRVECIVGDACQEAYATDPAMLRGHLARVGMDAFDDTLVPRIQELARSRFPLELQFDVGPDGAARPSLSASLRFQPGDWRDPAVPGGVEDVFRLAQGWNLADDRWQLLAGTAFAKRARLGEGSALLSCFPAFIKLRWRAGYAPDAKAYLMAGVI